MFGTVNRPLIRRIVYALVAAQLLLSAPVVSSLAASTTATAEMPCADSMPGGDDSKPCPCCPDGVMSIAACLNACSATAAGLPSAHNYLSETAAVPAAVPHFGNLAELADPPLKPPPIV
jgi:hypothetical protein